MHSELLLEFSSGWVCDNAMTAMSIRAGEPVDFSELIELCSGAKTLFSLATLVCRQMPQVRDCHRLWRDVLETFERAQIAWADVSVDNEPVLRFHLGQLSRLLELSRDRIDLYSVSQSEFLEHARRRADTSELSYGSSSEPKEEPGSWTDTQPAHVYSLGQI